MQKLTLSVDAAVIDRAKRYAEANQTSVSRLVETMLDLIATPAASGRALAPVLSRLRGSLKRGTVRDYQRHLEQKYR
jgi:adenine/guanine phosphoribosyltransferase-like PRPP-binding protein